MFVKLLEDWKLHGLPVDFCAAVPVVQNITSTSKLELYNNYTKAMHCDENSAFQLVKQLAENKNLLACCYIGVLYFAGFNVVRRDEEKGNHWINESLPFIRAEIDTSCPFAQHIYGFLLQKGIGGVKRNVVKAVKYYKLAANAGNAGAQNSLGWCFELGEGVTKDKNEAMRYLQVSRKPGAHGSPIYAWCALCTWYWSI